MIKFDEIELIAELEKLSPTKRIAFAAASATRIINNYAFYSSQIGQEDSAPIDTIQSLWDAIFNNSINLEKWELILNETLDLMPEENEHWTIWHALVDDALSSLAYTLRCTLTQSSQEAAWAARRAYEAVDQVVIKSIGEMSTYNRELTILSHVLIQRELERQARDINLLKIGNEKESINSIREYSKTEFLYKEGEES